MSRVMVAGLFILVGVSSCSKPPAGACEVAYDNLGSKGDACTVVSEDQCKDPVTPAIDLATLKMTKFTAGSTCQALGYKKSGCSNIAIAWSFKAECP
jgi:hypothetical protein